MTLIAMTNRIAGRALLACASAAVLWGCHGSSTTPQLRDARRAYEDAEDSPARTYAAEDLQVAHRALQRAEAAHDADPGSNNEAHLAYYAARKAEIARAHGEMAAAERAKAQAKANAEYQAKLARTAHRVDRADRADRADRRPVVAAKVDNDRDNDGIRDEHDVDVVADREGRPVAARADKRSSDERAAAAMQNLSQVASVREEPRGVVITLSGALLFPSGKDELSPIARQSLDQVASALGQQPEDKAILIEGHTDNSGGERQNEQLSGRRAQAVADHLMQRGIDDDRIRVTGYGESRPIADNETPEGRSANRRVEIVVGARGDQPVALSVDDDED
jgi:outer membrane protein OmpA-like peptidoglycan-associated protein